MKALNVVSIVVITSTYIALCVDAAAIKLPFAPAFSALDVVYLMFVLIFILQAATTPKVFDLEEQFSFYSSYHANLVNKLIHLLLIWPILWSGLVLFSDTTLIPLPISSPYLPTGVPWGPCCLSLGLALYFLRLDPVSGPITAALAVLCLVTAQLFREAWGPSAVVAAAILHAVSWVGQFIGHGVFERRAPSLLDNLAQSFLMAPHFVFLEAFFLGRRSPEAPRAHPAPGCQANGSLCRRKGLLILRKRRTHRWDRSFCIFPST
jgi:uncharacterized membrane protein YGL010W